MRNYDRINAPKPDGIEEKRAHIIGGGIAGLSAAIALVTDAHMPAGNVTIYDSLPVAGGSMDAAGGAGLAAAKDQQVGDGIGPRSAAMRARW